MISPTDLAIMQQAMAPLRAATCQILRNSPVKDAMGGQTDDWQVLATVQARVTPIVEATNEVIDEERLEAVMRWLIYLPAGQDVTERDRIVDPSGATFEINAVNGPRTIFIETICECQKVVS